MQSVAERTYRFLTREDKKRGGLIIIVFINNNTRYHYWEKKNELHLIKIIILTHYQSVWSARALTYIYIYTSVAAVVAITAQYWTRSERVQTKGWRSSGLSGFGTERVRRVVVCRGLSAVRVRCRIRVPRNGHKFTTRHSGMDRPIRWPSSTTCSVLAGATSVHHATPPSVNNIIFFTLELGQSRTIGCWRFIMRGEYWFILVKFASFNWKNKTF